MTTYYRITDAALIELTAAQFEALSVLKRSMLRKYIVDQRPTPSAMQFVQAGPVEVGAIEARRTWLLVEKTTEQLAAEQFNAEREADLAQIRLVYLALRNGTGTAAERLTRCERVLSRLLKDVFGSDPA